MRYLFVVKSGKGAEPTPALMEAMHKMARREIDETFDYRYSQLPSVFAQLIREGHLDESRLAGLSEDKLADIRRILSWAERR